MTGAFLALRESTSILLAIVAFCAIYANWNPIRSMPAVDFYQFWLVGHEVSAGEPGNVYSDSVRERIGRHALNRARAAGDRARIRTAEYRSVLETYSTPFL